MKQTIPLWALMGYLMGGAFAATYSSPNTDHPLFSVDIPDSWITQVGNDLLHTGPPDRSVYLGFWMVRRIENLQQAGEAVGRIAGQLVSDFQVENQEGTELNGMPAVFLDGLGLNEEGAEAEVSVAVFTPNADTFCIALYFASPEGGEKWGQDLTEILESMRPH